MLVLLDLLWEVDVEVDVDLDVVCGLLVLELVDLHEEVVEHPWETKMVFVT